MVHTEIRVQLANSTIRHPQGIIHNIAVKVQGDYVFADFVVLDALGDAEMSLILGRPFLRATHARIDVGNNTIQMKVRVRTKVLWLQSKKEFYYKAPPTNPKASREEGKGIRASFEFRPRSNKRHHFSNQRRTTSFPS
jgi:hypothetical protein